MNTDNPKNAARFDKDTYNSRAILVVDDDRQLAEALKFILGEEQMKVDVAFDGEEALGKMRESDYDVVVCDLVMPRLDGASLHARATELFPGLAEKFIFITGHPEDPKSWQFISGSQSKCLLKPFPIQDLIGVVKKAIG